MRSVLSRRLATVVLLLALGLPGCHSEETTDAPSPPWMDGVWTGRLAWEHDTTGHRLRLNLTDRHFAYPALNCRGTLQIDSITARVARMRFVAAHDSLHCGEVSGGIGELHRLDGTAPLHLQYWPHNQVKLYLAQLRPHE